MPPKRIKQIQSKTFRLWHFVFGALTMLDDVINYERSLGLFFISWFTGIFFENLMSEGKKNKKIFLNVYVGREIKK
jgi:hypothetical protein